MLHALDAQFRARGIVADAAQLAAAERLQQLHDELIAFKHARRTALRKWVVRPPLPRGVFLWGGVGRGKSLLMDSFYDSLPYRRKRRVHFHAFMHEVHERLKEYKDTSDPLLKVAERIASDTRLLCFDEFHISDIADAMILGRLFQALFDGGVVLCLTSNYPPDGLYPNGLQRQNFLPTIALLKEKLDVLEVDGGVDYRLRTLEKAEVYHVPANAQTEQRLAETFAELAGITGGAAAAGAAGGASQQGSIEVLGRKLPVKRRAAGVVWFDFATLCGGHRSQNDYLEIARRYHSVCLSNIPRMTREMASEARRFTWLVDVFYDHKVKLIMTAECEADQLYCEGTQASEFFRTVSRLIEMRTREYLAAAHHSA